MERRLRVQELVLGRRIEIVERRVMRRQIQQQEWVCIEPAECRGSVVIVGIAAST